MGCREKAGLACSTVAEIFQALKIQNDKLTVRPLLDQALAFEIDKRVFQGLHLKAKQVRDNATFQRVRDNVAFRPSCTFWRDTQQRNAANASTGVEG